MIHRIAKWFIFSVLMALVPLVALALSLLVHGVDVRLDLLTGRGELTIIAAALCARSVGELVGAESEAGSTPRIVVGGITLTLLLLSALHFADISSSYRTSTPINATTVSITSTILYISSILGGFSCLWLSESKQ